MDDPRDIARRSYRAFVDSDREAIEALIAEDFRFTSPLDNELDRETYFERCWANHAAITGFEFLRIAQDDDRVFVIYEGRTAESKFRNVEVLTIRGGQIHAAEVYFGWSLPHEAPAGGFIESEGERA